MKIKFVFDYDKKDDLLHIYCSEESFNIIDMGDIKLKISNHNNQIIGKVINMISTGSCDIFVVKYQDNEIFYPFLNQYINNININHKIIEINQFEGFFD